ncbi:hypothetical protein [Rhizobium leguminosarum]|uniref:hypothetical protein n=1 Tax=Rhizobium leguminosarum TaxID=384 RepID=UPI001C95A21F|nr:hypothetical protein [Rhizobium leguminosarum]MBY5623333.1 hypothetical protein [Rhizobium leguminosarum]
MAVEIRLQNIIQDAKNAGWEETDVLTAIIEVADNLMLAHSANAELGATKSAQTETRLMNSPAN